MLEKRIIPSLLLQGSGFVKTVKFQNPTYIGDPINTVRIFNDKFVHELFIMDIGASGKKSSPNWSLLERIASEAFMPLGYAGGVKTLDEIEKVFSLGFEKVGLNSVLFSNPQLMTDAAKLFGSQSLVGIIDVKKNFFGKQKVYNHVDKSSLSLDPLDYALKLQDLGAGEILLQSYDRDGTYTGYDLELISKLASKVKIPVISLGGASKADDLKSAIKAGSDAAAAGSIFIYHGPHKAVLINYPNRKEIDALIR